uniref:Leucine-rich repeat-containing N-terminal plant-type domain-containing protein n=1 Tax=Aegilops tauschii subsp. strangulata TaxID=200361 RepID=A0A453LKF0_AEGTS
MTSDPAKRLGFWRGHDCCQWSGATCDNQSCHVVKLNLRNAVKTFSLIFHPLLSQT